MAHGSKRHTWFTLAGLVLLTAHVLTMALAGFTRGAVGVAWVGTATGVLSAALCAFELVRVLDRRIELRAGDLHLCALLRVLAATALIAVIPAAFGVLSGRSLPLIGRALSSGAWRSLSRCSRA